MKSQTMHQLSIFKVFMANIAAFGVALSDVNEWLKFVSLLAAIGYTAWKWKNDASK